MGQSNKNHQLLKLIRRDISDLLFHFTKTPRKQLPNRDVLYSIPRQIEPDEFEQKLNHVWFKIRPEDKTIFIDAYNRKGKNMILKKMSHDEYLKLLPICQHVDYNSVVLSIKRPSTAADVLRKILFEKTLRGGAGGIKGGYKCVCFSEAPVSELSRIFALSAMSKRRSILPKYEPYGIAVTKEWLFQKGGRPVIYQSDDEYDRLPSDFQYRHKIYDPLKEIDYTWEREWRVLTDKLELNPTQTLVIVPTANDAWNFAYETARSEPSSYDDAGDPEGPECYEPVWQCVALEGLGISF